MTKKKEHRSDYLKIVGDLTAVEHITGCRSTTGVEELWRLVIRIQNVNGQHAGAVQSPYVLNVQDTLLERCVTGQRAGAVQSSYVLSEQDKLLERCVTGQRAGTVQSSYVLSERDKLLERCTCWYCSILLCPKRTRQVIGKV